MGMYRRKPSVFDAVQMNEDTLVDLGSEEPQLIHAGEWVITLPNGTKSMIHDVVFQRDFDPQGPE